ncbi:hypothetical protein CRUP_013463, partial [Coryphaenoides rupestris]
HHHGGALRVKGTAAAPSTEQRVAGSGLRCAAGDDMFKAPCSRLSGLVGASRTPTALPVADEGDSNGVIRHVQHVPAIDPSHPADIVPDRPDNVPTTTTTTTTSGEAAAAPPIISNVPSSSSSAGRTDGGTETSAEMLAETPHVQVETDAAREARLDRQWRELKVDYFEVPFDSNMNRTKNRPLVRGQIRDSPLTRRLSNAHSDALVESAVTMGPWWLLALDVSSRDSLGPVHEIGH